MAIQSPSSVPPSRPLQPRIYLAGPEVFLPEAAQLGKRKKALCAEYGFEGVFPLDADVDLRNGTPREVGLRMSAVNEDLIRACAGLIANITPFRGPSADVGTAYEMGFARGLGLTVCAYTNIATAFPERTTAALHNAVHRDAHGSLRDRHDMAIEELGLVDNLMLEGGIVASGGVLVIGQTSENEMFTSLDGFEQCLRQLRDLMQCKRP